MSEQFERLWQARYGTSEASGITDPAITENPMLRLLLGHRSVRKYTDEPVSDEMITAIVAAAQSASSSSNKQAFSIIEVRDEERRRRLTEHGRGSRFIPGAPVVLLFVADWARASQMAERAGVSDVTSEYLESTIVGVADAAIAAQNAVVAAEALGLGACFLGSMRNEPDFMADEYTTPHRAMILFGVSIGWPDPTEQAGIKPRLPQEAVLHREKYQDVAPEAIDAYDDALAEYYSAYGRQHRWSESLVSLVKDVSGLHGRDTMRESLARRGLTSN